MCMYEKIGNIPSEGLLILSIAHFLSMAHFSIRPSRFLNLLYFRFAHFFTRFLDYLLISSNDRLSITHFLDCSFLDCYFFPFPRLFIFLIYCFFNCSFHIFLIANFSISYFLDSSLDCSFLAFLFSQLLIS